MRRRLARTRRLPPDELRQKAQILREAVPDDSRVIAVCNAIEELIAAGWTVREGGPQPPRWPLHEAWGGKEPPERP
jgi:hypothetical protein